MVCVWHREKHSRRVCESWGKCLGESACESVRDEDNPRRVCIVLVLVKKRKLHPNTVHMASSLLPSLTRLTLPSDPIVPTAGPTDSKSRDSFYVDIVRSLTSGSGAEKIEALAKLQERVGDSDARVQRFVDADGINAMVNIVDLDPELSIKIFAAHVLHKLLVVQYARDNFVELGGVPILVRMLHELAGHNRKQALVPFIDLVQLLLQFHNIRALVLGIIRTEDVIVDLLAFLTPTLTAAAPSDEKSVQLVLSVLFNVVHATNEAMDRFYGLGGPAVIGKYLTSTSTSILKAAVLLMRIIAEREAEEYFYEDDEFEEDRVERDRVDNVQSLVALLRPGRVDDTNTRLEIVGCLEALVLPDLPEQTETHSLSKAQFATLTSAFDAMMGAGGIEVLISLMHVNMKDVEDESNWMSIRLLRKMMSMYLPYTGWRAVNATVRFAVAGGIAPLVDAGQRQDGNTDPEHVNRMQIHLSETFKLEEFLRKKSHIPKWIPMLLDVTNAVILKQPSEQDQEAKDCHEALPEERWGNLTRLRVSVCSYGQIYDLLSQYRAMRASEPYFEEVVDNCPVFAWMDDQKVLLRAALSRIPAVKGGKEVFIENHKPSLLAAELWIVHALSDVLLTNVSVPPVEDGTRLTVAQNEQVVKYHELLDGAHLLQAQYAWAVAHPNPLPHFVEAIRTEMRLNELLIMLVQKIEAPMYNNGSRTMTLRYELERYDEDEFVPGAEKRKLYNGWDTEWDEEEERRARKPRTTSAALRASIATLYGAEQTDATMTRLFQHLQFS